MPNFDIADFLELEPGQGRLCYRFAHRDMADEFQDYVRKMVEAVTGDSPLFCMTWPEKGEEHLVEVMKLHPGAPMRHIAAAVRQALQSS